MVGTTKDNYADLFTRALCGAEKNTHNTSGSTNKATIGGFLVCLNVPPATEFGIDYEVFRTGSKFLGVKFLPLGIHFVVFRSREQEHGIRQGFFVNIERHSQVIVREWSVEKEELGSPQRELNVENLERAVLTFQLDSGLGPYPKQHLKTWHRLSNYISASVLQRCGVEFGVILLPGHAVEDVRFSCETQDGVIPYFPDFPRTVRFTPLQRTRQDLTAEARTTYYFDRSERLEELIEEAFNGDWKEVIGELQVAFLIFLQLSSFAALEQWKQFIAMMCSCEQALSSYVPLFLAFMKLLMTQLEQIPEDFFQDELSSKNFLSPCLVSLLELIEDNDTPPQLRQKAPVLRHLLASRFHWNSDAELGLDELSPVIVPENELSIHGETYTTSSSLSSLPASLAQLHRRQEEERTNAAIAAAFFRK
ncbi:putative A1 cistron-splicing factor, AAR2, AAR2 domain superfamily [Plasmopara halstedii]